MMTATSSLLDENEGNEGSPTCTFANIAQLELSTSSMEEGFVIGNRSRSLSEHSHEHGPLTRLSFLIAEDQNKLDNKNDKTNHDVNKKNQGEEELPVRLAVRHSHPLLHSYHYQSESMPSLQSSRHHDPQRPPQTRGSSEDMKVNSEFWLQQRRVFQLGQPGKDHNEAVQDSSLSDNPPKPASCSGVIGWSSSSPSPITEAIAPLRKSMPQLRLRSHEMKQSSNNSNNKDCSQFSILSSFHMKHFTFRQLLLLYAGLAILLHTVANTGIHDSFYRHLDRRLSDVTDNQMEPTYHQVPQIVVLSPDPGFLEVIGTTHHLCAPDKLEAAEGQILADNYEPDDFLLSVQDHDAKFQAARVSQRSHLGGNVLVARFRIGRKLWHHIILEAAEASIHAAAAAAATQQFIDKDDSSNTTTEIDYRKPLQATILDKKQKTSTDGLPIWVDPSLSHYYHTNEIIQHNNTFFEYGSGSMDSFSQDPPSKSSLKRLRLNAHSHSSRHFPPAPKYSIGVTTRIRAPSALSIDCPPSCLHRKLQAWMAHYRKLGVQQFYILDNAPPAVPSLDFPNTNDTVGMTYIRTHLPEKDMNCYGQITQPGQFLLDNAIIRAANVVWMLVVALDEYVVPQWQTSNHTDLSLPNFVSEVFREHQERDVKSDTRSTYAGDIPSLTFPVEQVCAQVMPTKQQDFSLLDRQRMSVWNSNSIRAVVRAENVDTFHKGVAFPLRYDTTNSSKTHHSDRNVPAIRLDRRQQAWIAKLDDPSGHRQHDHHHHGRPSCRNGKQ